MSHTAPIMIDEAAGATPTGLVARALVRRAHYTIIRSQSDPAVVARVINELVALDGRGVTACALHLTGTEIDACRTGTATPDTYRTITAAVDASG